LSRGEAVVSMFLMHAYLVAGGATKRALCLAALVFAAQPSLRGVGHPHQPDVEGSACAVSADGSVIVGVSSSTSSGEASRSVNGSGLEGFGHLPGGSSFRAPIKTSGADLCARVRRAGTPAPRCALLVALGQDLGVSADGAVVVGYSDFNLAYEPFRWTQSGGMSTHLIHTSRFVFRVTSRSTNSYAPGAARAHLTQRAAKTGQGLTRRIRAGLCRTRSAP
jgi:hypothetical protein